MILKSEGQSIKFVNSPEREKKYAVLAYSNFLKEFGNTLDQEILANVLSGLTSLIVEEKINSGGLFQLASTSQTQEVENMLMDG